MKHNGQLLHALIKRKRLVKKEVAEKMGISPVYLSKMFKMDTLNTGQLEKICSVIEEDPAQFFDYRGSQEAGLIKIVDDIQPQSVIETHEHKSPFISGQSGSNEALYLIERLLQEKERIIKIKDQLLEEKDKMIKMLLENQQRFCRHKKDFTESGEFKGQ